MAYEYVAPDQNVTLGQPIIFNASIPCRNGNVYHEDGSGIFILSAKNIKCNCPNSLAQYQVIFNGNVAVPTGGTVGPITVGIELDGVAVPYSLAIFPAAEVDVFGNVTSTKIVTIPKICGCERLSINYIAGDAANIDINDGNVTIARLA